MSSRRSPRRSPRHSGQLAAQRGDSFQILIERYLQQLGIYCIKTV